MTRSFDASHTDLSASGAWPLWSWVSDDTPARGLRSGLALGEFSSCPLTEPLEHEPCGLLGNANLLAELQAGYALACGYEQVHGIEPFVQGNVAALEDRPCANRKIERTGIAAIEANLGLLPDALTALALRAERAIGPEAGFKVNPRRFSGREHLEKLEGANCALAHKSPFFSCLKTVEVGLFCMDRNDIVLPRDIRPVTPMTGRLPTDKTHLFHKWTREDEQRDFLKGISNIKAIRLFCCITGLKCKALHLFCGVVVCVIRRSGITESKQSLGEGKSSQFHLLVGFVVTLRAHFQTGVLYQFHRRFHLTNLLCPAIAPVTVQVIHAADIFAGSMFPCEEFHHSGVLAQIDEISHRSLPLTAKPIPELLTWELIFDGLRDCILMLPCGHVFLTGFNAAKLNEIAVHADRVIVEKSRVAVVSISQFDLHNASRTVSIVDNSLHFVKNFSRFVLKGLASHVYNSQIKIIS